MTIIKHDGTANPSDPYIRTYTGRKFFYKRPTPEIICIDDIAHALANECRYGGHAIKHYSVGQHSVLCAIHVPSKYRLEALLHDASEAYLKDIPSPLKRLLPGYRDMEDSLQLLIRSVFGLPAEESDEVKLADMRMLITEQRDLMTRHEPEDSPPGYAPYPQHISVWTPAHTETIFKDAFHIYGGE